MKYISNAQIWNFKKLDNMFDANFISYFIPPTPNNPKYTSKTHLLKFEFQLLKL